MWDGDSVEIKEVEFTNFDTVIFPGRKEMTMEKFFTFFEKNIKKRKITQCEYKQKTNKITFFYKKDLYEIYMEESSSSKGVILLNLIKLEENLRKEKEYREEMKRNQEELLAEARNGNICSEEVKQLYIQELKNSMGFKEKFKKVLEIRKQALEDSKFDPILEQEKLLLQSFWIGIPLVGFIASLCFLPNSIILPLILITWAVIGCIDVFKYETLSLQFIFKFIKGLFTSNLFNNKMVKHKIKYLEKLKFPSNDSFFRRVKIFSEPVKEKISLINEKLLMLNKSERELFLAKMTSKVEEIEKRIFAKASDGISSEDVSVINCEFLRYLEVVYEEADRLLDMSKDVRETYAFTGKPRGMVLTSDGTKVKRKQ